MVELEEAFNASLTIEAIYHINENTDSTLDIASNPILAAGDKVYLTKFQLQVFPRNTASLIL
ncbi:hypothetical protein O9929_26295 [Vibrio lentus]|nr:hypothetical protein [Vibrio lentus]